VRVAHTDPVKIATLRCGLAFIESEATNLSTRTRAEEERWDSEIADDYDRLAKDALRLEMQ
jgi:hypothetical protein